MKNSLNKHLLGAVLSAVLVGCGGSGGTESSGGGPGPGPGPDPVPDFSKDDAFGDNVENAYGVAACTVVPVDNKPETVTIAAALNSKSFGFDADHQRVWDYLCLGAPSRGVESVSYLLPFTEILDGATSADTTVPYHDMLANGTIVGGIPMNNVRATYDITEYDRNIAALDRFTITVTDDNNNTYELEAVTGQVDNPEAEGKVNLVTTRDLINKRSINVAVSNGIIQWSPGGSGGGDTSVWFQHNIQSSVTQGWAVNVIERIFAHNLNGTLNPELTQLFEAYAGFPQESLKTTIVYSGMPTEDGGAGTIEYRIPFNDFAFDDADNNTDVEFYDTYIDYKVKDGVVIDMAIKGTIRDLSNLAGTTTVQLEFYPNSADNGNVTP